VRLDPDQLEWIVREVVRRLRAGDADAAPPAPSDSHITLTQTLITVATLKHKLDGVTQVSISKRAVITPSARDILKEKQIQLLRS
jgi:hypothetical protein